MKKMIAAAAVAAAACLSLAACTAGDFGNYNEAPSSGFVDVKLESSSETTGNYNYNSVVEQAFKEVAEEPSSYFSLDRNTATYSLVRAQLNNSHMVSADSVRIEEMINYFSYDYAAPTDEAVALSGYLSDCPWNEAHKLMLIGLKTKEYILENVASNYVFLIDRSGSMAGASRIGLAKTALGYAVDSLGENDTLSIVTYASGVNTVLDGERCTEENKANVKAKIFDLAAYGSTNGSGGLQLAYEIAQSHYIVGGNNRVILISDGDFNVGMSSQSELKELITQKAESGVYLSVIGVGMGNLRDSVLETLATCGNGNYAYLDNETEAYKVFTEELKGTLVTVAKDARAGVTFSEAVKSYRLIGYDTKLLSAEEFEDFNKDTGEIGSNLCVSVLYEIELNGQYDGGNEVLAQAEVRYKDSADGADEMNSVTLSLTLGAPSSDDLSFISCVAEFGLVLRQSQYGGTACITNVLNRLNNLSSYLADDPYKEQFVSLVGKASELGYTDIKAQEYAA